MKIESKKLYLDEEYSESEDNIYDQYHEYSYRIGSFLMDFSSLEDTIDSLLIERINDRSHEFGFQTIKLFKFKQKIILLRDNYKSLIRYLSSDSKKLRLLSIVDSSYADLVKLSEFRNKVAHANWETLDKNFFVTTDVKEDTQGVYFVRTKISCRLLYNASRKCGSLSKRIFNDHEKILDNTLRRRM
tara:strand:+ start:4332 stop:4892 length:561 start_codon:yes stop_codon:yes gene_type:complete